MPHVGGSYHVIRRTRLLTILRSGQTMGTCTSSGYLGAARKYQRKVLGQNLARRKHAPDAVIRFEPMKSATPRKRLVQVRVKVENPA